MDDYSFEKLMDGIRRQVRVTFPNEVQCPECGYFDITDPAVRKVLDSAGRDPNEARCQCQDRAEELSRRLWGESNLPHLSANHPPRTLANYERIAGTENALAAVNAFMSDPDHVLTLVGGSGTGKTHLLEAIGRHFIELGRSVHYDFVPDFLDELRDTYGGGWRAHSSCFDGTPAQCPYLALRRRGAG